MNFSNVDLPSNRRFGFFAGSLASGLGTYLLLKFDFLTALPVLSTGCLFFVLATTKDDILLPLNMVWMRFGLLLGRIVNPLVMGFLFFGLFAPIGIFMRLFQRDELRIKFKPKTSYWVSRQYSSEMADGFKNQY